MSAADPQSNLGTSAENSAAQPRPLANQVKRGLAWGLASNLILRMGSLAVGILLARLLTPGAFGVYAVALTVQSILLTLADLGLSADLIRTDEPDRRAPTVATLSLISGALLSALMCTIAVPLASLLGSPQAAPVIIVLSFTLILSSAGVVPYAKLVRDFEQKKLFAASAADFVVATGVTVVLVLIGMGPMALAISRLVAQSTATALQFLLSHTTPRLGFDRRIAGLSLRFGIPLAGANLLSWILLNVDNIVIATVAGDVALGFYVLAFNVSSWPMSAIGTAIRSVSLAAFSRSAAAREQLGSDDREPMLATGSALSWAAALPAGSLLAVLAVPLVSILYGQQWIPSAAALAGLGLFGALRVLFDLMATYLMARGDARSVFIIQALWIAALTPVMIIATKEFGIAGSGWAQVAVGACIILPAYLLALRRAGANVGALLRSMWPPLLAGIPAWCVADVVATSISPPVISVLLGAAAGGTVYLALLFRWLRGVLEAARTNRTVAAGASHFAHE